jgi:hypothetical protein
MSQIYSEQLEEKFLFNMRRQFLNIEFLSFEKDLPCTCSTCQAYSVNYS